MIRRDKGKENSITDRAALLGIVNAIDRALEGERVAAQVGRPKPNVV
jgi:hypothetical protein